MGLGIAIYSITIGLVIGIISSIIFMFTKGRNENLGAKIINFFTMIIVAGIISTIITFIVMIVYINLTS